MVFQPAAHVSDGSAAPGDPGTEGGSPVRVSHSLSLAYLPMEEQMIGGVLREEEHIDEVNEDTGGRGGAGS